MKDACTSEFDSVAQLARDACEPKLVTIVHPDDCQLKAQLLVARGGDGTINVESVAGYLDAERTRPRRRRGTAKLTDLASFVAHCNRFKSDASALFACDSPTAPEILAVLDYHPAGPNSLPDNGTHRCSYAFPLSDEWKAWTAANGKAMSQAEFAAFLEDRITDLTDPVEDPGAIAKGLSQAAGIKFAAPAQILEVSRGLTVHANHAVKQAVNLGTGEASIAFVEEHRDSSGAPIKVPTGFLVALPVFRAGNAWRLPVRLRYRLREGRITWSFELYRAERVFDAAFREACALATKETGLPLFMGQPE